MAHVVGLTARLGAVVAALLLPACSGGGPKLYPVRGKVLYLDQPAEGATVVFQLAGGSADAPMPSGTVGADGSFSLSTYPHGTGAPAGEYVVLITWLAPKTDQLENSKNKLPGRYSMATGSPLRATVKPGTNELEPFRLTK
ncbi:MAG: hypothetical protein J2P46_17440 [Zavarzinella sp.]|nr:hypothetical protein [Zavarzinella sp.]